MRPVEFAPEAIIQAGLALQAVGRNITGFALRQKVGGGNPSRLKQVWDEHLASQSVVNVEPVAELPLEVAEEVALVTKALTERLMAMAVDLNDKAVKAAERRVHEVVRSAGEQRAQAERELADASQTVDELEIKLDEATEAAEGLAVSLRMGQAHQQTQAIELAQLHERLAAVEAERLRFQQEAQGLRSELTQQKEQSLRVLAERDQAQGQLLAVTAKAEAAAQAQQDLATRQAQEIERHVANLTRVEQEREEARHNASAAREAAAKLGGQLESLQAQVSSLLEVVRERQAMPLAVMTPDILPG
jgi:colicin import membrane protein